MSDAPNDKEQLAPSFGAIAPAAGPVGEVLIERGFLSQAAVGKLERDAQGAPTGVRVLAAVERARHGRSGRELERREDPPAPAPDAPFIEQMRHRVSTRAGRERYKLRQQTVEPVFGIIKETLGFRRLLAPSGATLRAAFGRLFASTPRCCPSGDLRSAISLRSVRSARLSLRGLGQVSLEWTLVSLAYNLKRLFHCGARLAAA